MSHQFDLTVIGSGPGGYVAAIRAAQLGMKVALIEKESFGGTCLNVGCIPSKALLESSEHFHQAERNFKSHGIKISEMSLDLTRMQKRRVKVVKTSVKGIEFLLKKNKITTFKGHGKIKSPTQVTVVAESRPTESHVSNAPGTTNTEITTKKILLATGSESSPLPPVPCDGEHIITSTEALELQTVPEHLIVIGGGVIGLEIGSIWGRLGSKVTVIEYLDKILPPMDNELGTTLQKCLKKINFSFALSTKVVSASVADGQVTVTAEKSGGEKIQYRGDKVLVAVGRRPFTKNLGLESVGIETDSRGFIEVDENYQTSNPGIFAIGDIIPGPMLAHKASEEGVVCVERIAGHKALLNYSTIPGVVYTWPEVASVGRSEEELKKDGVEYKVGTFPFRASGRARAAEESDGFVKVLSGKIDDEILGVHMIGPRCADLITQAVVAMEYKATAEDIAMICHPHPTFTEAVKEAALEASGLGAIHM